MSNTLVKSVCRAMERIAPLRLAEKWDNVGLLLESPVHKPECRKILLTIDLTSSVLSESLAKKTSVIVSYHPTIFGAVKSFTLSKPLQASLLQCAAQGISVYCPHTALDSVWGGINDWLAEGCMKGKDDGEISALIGEKLNAASGVSEGAEGRLVTLKEPIAVDVLEKRIKSHLKLSQIQVGYPATVESRSSPVRTIAICAGSGGSMLLGQQADVYFTGEMAHHEVLAAVAAGKHVILCGHTNTERGYLPILAAKLTHELQGDEFKDQGLGDVEVLVSQKDQHPLEFV
ncbi:NGG1 interacting factor 3-like protein [Crassisporium funariophilum]|nr:NGG1 interacting factor 3-like protein [Crassisporium funariophilum]